MMGRDLRGRGGLAEKPNPRDQAKGRAEHRTLNIEHTTSNGPAFTRSMLDVRCSMLDVRSCGSAGASPGFAQKSETRSTKSETNPKLEIQSSKQAIDATQVSDFGFRACFGFRASDFEFLVKPQIGRRANSRVSAFYQGLGTGNDYAPALRER